MYLYEKRITSVFIITVLFSVVITAQPYNQTFPKQMIGIDESLKRAINENGVMTPVLNQFQEITSTDGMAGDSFGWSVSINGETVVIGSPVDSDGGFGSGSAYIYTRSGGVWSEQAKLTATDASSNTGLGVSVAIDGETVVAGAYNDDDGGAGSGSAYIFIRSGTSWTQQAKLTASDAASSDAFGYFVAIDDDTAVIGAPFDDSVNSNSGSAYVFTRSGTVWTEHRKLVASSEATDDLNGLSVSISGTTVITGAFLRDVIAFSPFTGVTKRTLAKTKSVDSKNSNLAGVNQGVAFFFNLLPPTAANSTISGRVLSPNGRAIPRAAVYLTTQDGESITARTNQFGHFKFEDIEVGQTLVMNVFSKRYQFQTQLINFDDSINDLEFIADK